MELTLEQKLGLFAAAMVALTGSAIGIYCVCLTMLFC